MIIKSHFMKIDEPINGVVNCVVRIQFVFILSVSSNLVSHTCALEN